jgi:hypothetical protein
VDSASTDPKGEPVQPVLRPRPPQRFAKGVLAALVLTAAFALLAACEQTPAASVRPWSVAEIAGVFDLAELGSLTADPIARTLVLDGRPLPADVLERFPHMTMGRSKNLLRLAPDVILTMDPLARDFVLQASPDTLRDRLADYGLSVADLHAAWADGGDVDLDALHAIAARLDATVSTANAAAPAGTRLLADLGVTR